MGIFSRKKNDSHEERFVLVDDVFELNNAEKNGDTDSGKAPHALTSDEIMNQQNSGSTESSAERENPLEQMRRQMLENAQKRMEPKLQEEPGDAETVAFDIVQPEEPIEVIADEPVESVEQQEIPAEIFVSQEPENEQPPEPESEPEIPETELSFLENFEEPKRVLEDFFPPEQTEQNEPSTLPPANPDTGVARTVLPPKTESKPSPENNAPLMERCMPYIVDDEGNNVSDNKKPIYELESVADILRSESERTLEKLSRKYDFTTEIQISQSDLAADTTLPAEPPKEMFDEDPDETQKPVLSDIDTAVLPRIDTADVPSDTATIRFTPVKKADGNTDHITVSTMTRAADLTDEIGALAMPKNAQKEPDKILQTEFEEFKPSMSDGPAETKRIMRRLSLQKRNAFLQMLGTLLLTLLSGVYLLPTSHALITNPKTPLLFGTILLGLQTVLNGDMFLSLKKAFGRRAVPDASAAAVSVFGLLTGGFAVYQQSNTVYHCYALLTTVMVLILFRSVTKFWLASAKLGNFKVIAANREKQAVMMLDDPSVTFAMANNAVDGNALIATPRPAASVGDYLKYAEFSPVMDGKFAIVFNISLALALIIGLAVGAKLRGVIYGLFAATVILGIPALPTAFFMDILPMYHAAGRLNKKGAMIAGPYAAEQLNKANAIVLASRDLFPNGSVSLHDMKVLEDNNLDHILVRAAALTEAVDSPLTPLFGEIVHSNESYQLPDPDTVKYEERLGISGWVEEELLFIGNRTLMEAHGIIVPDIEIDRKILRQGFFPVYIACNGKACALLTVQYHVRDEIAAELRRVTDLGVVLLVNNCDPNMTAEMICDYFGLYDDSVRVMSSSGVHAYKNAATTVECQSAPAAFRRNPLTIAQIVNCAARVCRSNRILTAVYTLLICIGAVLFAYLTFTGSGLPGGKTLLAVALLSAVGSYLIHLIKKP